MLDEAESVNVNLEFTVPLAARRSHLRLFCHTSHAQHHFHCSASYLVTTMSPSYTLRDYVPLALAPSIDTRIHQLFERARRKPRR